MERSDIPPKRDFHTLIVFGCRCGLIVECTYAENPCNPLIPLIRDLDNGCVQVFGFGCGLIVECAYTENPCNPLIQIIRDSDNDGVVEIESTERVERQESAER